MFETSIQDGIATLTLKNGKVNAMCLEFCQSIVDEFTRLQKSDLVHSAILTAPGDVFSAGIDLKRLVREDNQYLDRFLPALRNLFRTAFAFEKPLIGLINGHALAGGCVLACACDYRIAVPHARIGIPEMRIGVPLPTLGIEIMRLAATGPAFRQIVSNGKTFSNEAAITAGLVDGIAEHDAAGEQARKAASQFAMLPREVFAHTKRQVRSVAWKNIEQGELEFEPAVDKMWRSDSIRQSIADYVERVL